MHHGPKAVEEGGNTVAYRWLDVDAPISTAPSGALPAFRLFRRRRVRPILGAMTRALLPIGLVGLALVATGVVLWASYGEALFAEALLSRLAGCLG